MDLTNPQSLNRYAYALNNPTTLTDPLGLCGGSDYSFTDPNTGITTVVGDSPCPIPTVPCSDMDGYDCGYGPGQQGEYPYGPAPGSSGGTGVGTPAPQPPAPKPALNPSQAQTSMDACMGSGRGLSGNLALVGRSGGIPGQTVEPGTAAVIPQQFGVPSGSALAPYAPNIFGVMGSAWFSSATDVIGGKSPIPGVNVRTALQEIYPGQLILEIPGAADQGANAPVLINVPASLGCPAGTSPALGDPVLPPPGVVNAVRHRVAH